MRGTYLHTDRRLAASRVLAGGRGTYYGGDMVNTDMDSWLRGLLIKRTPDALAVIGDLFEAVQRQGHCSANDIRDRTFDEPNIIGGVFRILPKFGVTSCGERLKTTAKRKHARRVDKYLVTDHARFRASLSAVRGLLLEAAGEKQGELF